jgi:hypothetical protein
MIMIIQNREGGNEVVILKKFKNSKSIISKDFLNEVNT